MFLAIGKRMCLPDIDEVKRIISNWGIGNSRILKVFLFGSYVTNTKSPPGDIDIAIKISDKPGDTASGFWSGTGNRERMEKELISLLNYKVHLWHFNDNETPIIKKAVEEANSCIYDITNETHAS